MRCYICQNHKVRYLLNPYRGSAIFQCERCTNAFTVPRPRVHYEKKQFCIHKSSEIEEYKSYARPILDFIIEEIKKGKLLDVGCGSGYLIEEAQKRGFKAFGVEPSPSAVAFCRKRNLNVTKGFLDGKYYSPSSFDIVVASHVLEHVKNPYDFLAICRKILKPSGLLCLSQTNYTGTIPQLYNRFWEGWVPSEHLLHFSPKGIQFLLKETYFQVKKIKIVPLGYHLRFPWGNFSTIACDIYYSVNYLISKLKIFSNFIGDQMYILASKR